MAESKHSSTYVLLYDTNTDSAWFCLASVANKILSNNPTIEEISPMDESYRAIKAMAPSIPADVQ